LARSRRMPRSPWLKGWSERGFAGLPLGVTRRCRALPVGSAGLAPCGSDGCARISGSTRSRRPARSSGSEQVEPCPPCCRSMPCGPVDVDDAEGCCRCARHTPEGQGASDSNSNRSGSDPQVHQPFELADFLTKATHPRAVCRLHPHGGREVTVPGRPVPVPSLGRGTCPGGISQGCRLAGGDHLGFEFAQPRTAAGDFQRQHLPVERVR